MLSGEGSENGENTAIGLISKKATLHVRETSRNFLITRFMEEITYVFLFTFFSLPLALTLVAGSISHFLTAATKLSCCFSKKLYRLFFISRFSSLSLSVFSLSFAGLSPFFSFSLSLSFSIFQICRHGN